MAREIMASTDAPAFFADGPVDTVLQVAVPVPLGAEMCLSMTIIRHSLL